MYECVCFLFYFFHQLQKIVCWACLHSYTLYTYMWKRMKELFDLFRWMYFISIVEYIDFTTNQKDIRCGCSARWLFFNFPFTFFVCSLRFTFSFSFSLSIYLSLFVYFSTSSNCLWKFHFVNSLIFFFVLLVVVAAVVRFQFVFSVFAIECCAYFEALCINFFPSSVYLST